MNGSFVIIKKKTVTMLPETSSNNEHDMYTLLIADILSLLVRSQLEIFGSFRLVIFHSAESVSKFSLKLCNHYKPHHYNQLALNRVSQGNYVLVVISFSHEQDGDDKGSKKKSKKKKRRKLEENLESIGLCCKHVE